jgi:uncharacterized protein YkwD
MSSRFVRAQALLALLALGLGFGCGPRAAARFPGERIPIPEHATEYSTAARPDGVLGGAEAERLRADIAAALAQRGAAAEADGALGATASWILNEANQGHAIDLLGADSASRHFGFGGVLTTLATFDMQTRDDWRQMLERTPENVRITRFGICVSPQGRSAAVVFGNTDVSYESIPRSFEPGQTITLKGEVSPRFSGAHLYLTKPDGTVDEKRVAGRAFNAAFSLATAGKYRLEVMGDGATGPVVVSNIPLFVGVPEAPAGGSTGTVLDPEAAEARLLSLLNEARRKAGLAALRSDSELREIALSHTEDMVRHNFFGHVSPTTGAPEDRARRSGVLVSSFGENVAIATTPEVVHEGLMDSPGHRANMLRAEFTHVGIGVEKNDNGLVVTMAFGRRPSLSALPRSAEQLEPAIIALRSQKGVPPANADSVYRVAAQAGAHAFATGDDRNEISRAVDSALKKEVERVRSGRSGGCLLTLELLELGQLGEVAELALPELRRFGVGAEMRKDEKGTRLSTVFLLEGIPCAAGK